MPNRDGKGPRSRSRYPSRPKGGRKRGSVKCHYTKCTARNAGQREKYLVL